MYTLRSHMSAVEYTCVFHRPTTTIIKITKFVSLYHIAKPIPYQKKAKFDSTRHKLNTLKHPYQTPNTQDLKFGNKPKVLG